MDRIFDFVRSELFLSLAGGFALGVAGLAVVKPASADIGQVEQARAITVGAPVHEIASLNN
ncbi:MAG: hypothetical protein WBO17_10990 [Sphingorhabdus sp.]